MVKKGPSRFKKGEKPPLLRGVETISGKRIRNLPSMHNNLTLPRDARRNAVKAGLGPGMRIAIKKGFGYEMDSAIKTGSDGNRYLNFKPAWGRELHSAVKKGLKKQVFKILETDDSKIDKRASFKSLVRKAKKSK
jgi:hypothetical protein